MSDAANTGAMRAGRAESRMLAWLRALRPHQWLKNLLLLVPLLAAHKLQDSGAISAALLGLGAFCLCASGTYLLNDILDRRADRAHPRKRNRPFASGVLSATAGLVVAPLLVIASFALAWQLPQAFLFALAAYLVGTLAYSLFAKRVAILDVLVLAGLYVLRVLAGGAATGIPISFWLLAFSLFLFTSLAMLKRYTELADLRANGGTFAAGRGYAIDDLPLIQMLGVTGGLVSVLVLALYIESAASVALYHDHRWLWLLCPLLLYLIARAWLVAHRGKMHDDPLVAFARDPVAWLLAGLAGAIIWMAS